MYLVIKNTECLTTDWTGTFFLILNRNDFFFKIFISLTLYEIQDSFRKGGGSQVDAQDAEN